MFEKLDADTNGTLDEDELLAGKPKTMTKEKAAQIYDVLDIDKSGHVTMDEFAAGTQTAPGMGLLGQLSSDALDVLMQLQQQGGAMANSGGGNSSTDQAFDALDTNKDGVVSEEEFLAEHPEIASAEQAKKLFEALDVDRNGSIDQDQVQQVVDATTPPNLMVSNLLDTDLQAADSNASFAGVASLFGSNAGGPSSAYQLFELLDSEAEGATTSTA
jgi:Ca2+-binding EF-hand superfamily protein